MRFYFTHHDKELSVWYNNLFPDKIQVEVREDGHTEDAEVDLIKDGQTTYFVWDGFRFYMNKFGYIPVEEVYQKERYTEYDLVHTVLREGTDNVVIEREVSKHSWKKDSKSIMIPCMIEGDVLFKIWTGYKWHIKPIFEDDRYNYGDYHTYVCDIAGLVFKGIWKIRRATEKEKEAIQAQKRINAEYDKLDSDGKYNFDREEAIERLKLKEKIYR